MFMFYNGLSPPLMNYIFKLRAENPINLRQVSEFSRPMVKSEYNRTESISYLGPKIWDILPEKLMNIENLKHFKKEIKTWKPDIAHVGCVKFKGRISLKLKIFSRDSCVVYLYCYRIYVFYFTVILYMRILVGLFYLICFFYIYIKYFMFNRFFK